MKIHKNKKHFIFEILFIILIFIVLGLLIEKKYKIEIKPKTEQLTKKPIAR